MIRRARALRCGIDDALRAPVALSGRTQRRAGAATVTPGALLNYTPSACWPEDRSTSVSNELRYFNSSGVLTSTGIVNLSSQLRQYVRFDTAWVHSDPDTLETWTVGDLISSSLTWTRSLRMGGVQWKRSFDLRPDLLTFPSAALGGSAVVPSAVTLYIGVRQLETAVPSGPFIINQVAGINGAGQATLVTRDAAGRAVSTTLPLYVDTRMLAGGPDRLLGRAGRAAAPLHHRLVRLCADAGRQRLAAARPQRQPDAGSAWRRRQGVLNGGAGMLWRLGQAGVVSASLAGSGGTGRGAQASLGYQYLSPRFGVDLQSQRASVGYSDLGTAEGSPVVRANDRINVNLSLFGGQGWA
jgi:outer membrane usher protein